MAAPGDVTSKDGARFPALPSPWHCDVTVTYWLWELVPRVRLPAVPICFCLRVVAVRCLSACTICAASKSPEWQCQYISCLGTLVAAASRIDTELLQPCACCRQFSLSSRQFSRVSRRHVVPRAEG
jgi:hypothetical protein